MPYVKSFPKTFKLQGPEIGGSWPQPSDCEFQSSHIILSSCWFHWASIEAWILAHFSDFHRNTRLLFCFSHFADCTESSERRIESVSQDSKIHPILSLFLNISPSHTSLSCGVILSLSFLLSFLWSQDQIFLLHFFMQRNSDPFWPYLQIQVLAFLCIIKHSGKLLIIRLFLEKAEFLFFFSVTY